MTEQQTVVKAGRVWLALPDAIAFDTEEQARLYASAPDMKSALDKILGELSVRGSISRDDWRVAGAVAALAKAKGAQS